MSHYSSQYHVDSSQYTASAPYESKTTLIFGTQVSLSDTADRFRAFLAQSNVLGDLPSNDISLTIDGSCLPRELSSVLIDYPTDVLPIFEHALADYILEKNPNFVINTISLAFKNCGYPLTRVFDPFLVDKIVTFRGVVVRVEGVVPFCVSEVLTCCLCNVDVRVCEDSVVEGAYDAEYVRALSVLNQSLENESGSGVSRGLTRDRQHIPELVRTNERRMSSLVNNENSNANFNADTSPGSHNSEIGADAPFRYNPTGNLLIHSATTPHFSCFPKAVRPPLSTFSKDSCPNCSSRYSLTLNRYRSTFLDSQTLRVQELPSDVPFSGTPLSFDVKCFGPFCSSLHPGMRVSLVGVFRLKSVLTNDKKMVKSGFKSVIELLSSSVLGEGSENINKNFCENFSIRKNQKMIELNKATTADKNDDSDVEKDIFNKTDGMPGQDPDLSSSRFLYEISRLPRLLLRQILTNSVAPQVHAHDLAKRAILLQLAGGTTKNRGRSSIHVLLIGDPGIAKSQLLRFASSVTQGCYAAGSGASACGLTASVVRSNGSFVLEPGALVLSTNKICCIDEFDKLYDTTKIALYEAMEQQTISVAKAGIVATLQAKCSVLASCNPKSSVYDFRKSVVENINLPCALLSRFDVVCVLIDMKDPALDSEIGKHILSMYTKNASHQNTRSELPFNSAIIDGSSSEPKSGESKVEENDGVVLTENISKPHNTTQNADSETLNFQKINRSYSEHNSVAESKVSQYVQGKLSLITDDSFILTPMNISQASKNHHLDPQTFTAYMKLVKDLKPSLTMDAKMALKAKYKQMRQMNSGKTITATTRQLESMIRLSEAFAKIEVNPHVEKEHVESAYELLKEAMMIYAVDPKTGIIDMDIINTGKSAHKRNKLQRIIEDITEKITKDGAISTEEIKDICQEYFKEVLETLENTNEYVITPTQITRA